MSGSSGFGWRDRVRADVKRTAKRGKRRSDAQSRLNIELLPGIVPLLMAAARRRQVSPTGYIRRAMLSFIAHDLNMRLEDVLVHDPRFSPPGSRHPIPDPEGRMGGSWEIEDLR
jgi:hypothetical protein